MSISLIRIYLATALITLSCSSTIAVTEPLTSSNFSNETPYLDRRPNISREVRESGERRLLEQLNLTSEQQEVITQIQQKYAEQITQSKNTLRAERDKLQEMMTGNESTANIRSQHEKVVNLDRQLHNLRFESMLEMREVLTPEQRQQFASIMDEKRANFQRRLNNPNEVQP
jgi:Spy/CpxP family protein refolding chaperone